jgi:hypothetical protein
MGETGVNFLHSVHYPWTRTIPVGPGRPIYFAFQSIEIITPGADGLEAYQGQRNYKIYNGSIIFNPGGALVVGMAATAAATIIF